MEGVSGAGVEDERKPLSEVVGDCVQRWFQDALKEARRGDTAMQVLVAQMYYSGYGIPKNEHKTYRPEAIRRNPESFEGADDQSSEDRRSRIKEEVIKAKEQYIASAREEHGLIRHQDTGLRPGRWAPNVQDIMLVTLILMKQMMIPRINSIKG